MAFGGPGGHGGGHGGFGGPGHGGGHFGGPGFHGGCHGFHGGFHGGFGFFGHDHGMPGHHGEHGNVTSSDAGIDFDNDLEPEGLVDRLMDRIFVRKPILKPQQRCDYLPTPRAKAIAGTMTLLALIQGCVMFASNILASKIWCLGPFIVDGGLLLFPFTYVIGDVIVELFYLDTANRILKWVCFINALGLIALSVLHLLPDAPGVDNSAINVVFANSARIFLGSIIALITSGHINNWVYERMRQLTTARQIGSRSWVSSFFARLADTTLFTIIAFAGRNSSLLAIGKQIFSSFFVGMLLETCMIPITIWLVYQFKDAMDKE